MRDLVDTDRERIAQECLQGRAAVPGIGGVVQCTDHQLGDQLLGVTQVVDIRGDSINLQINYWRLIINGHVENRVALCWG
jgi:cobyrinic acid a,c-diamide synthase